MGYRQKEACFLIIDACMSSPSVGFPKETNKVEVAKKAADFYVRRFLQEQRKTDQVGIIALNGIQCEEICLIQSAHLTHRQKIAEITAHDSAGDETLGDAISLAADRIKERTKTNKFKRTIVLFTDGSHCGNVLEAKDEFSEYDDVEFIVYGIDFTLGNRSQECVEGEALLSAVFGPESIRPVTCFRDVYKLTKRAVSQVKKWKGEMEVTSRCKFHCIMVARIAEDKLKSLVKRSKLALEESGMQDLDEFLSSDLGMVKMDRKYTSSEDLDREVSPEERTKAYRYGKDLLPMFPADEEAMKLEDTQSCLKVIGIINVSELPRNYLISPTNTVVADPGSANSQQGFSAFCQALSETNKVATARFVAKDGKNPKFVALIPGKIKQHNIDCLWHIQLPTMEDIRDYHFESLNMDISAAEAMATENYVKAMTLTSKDGVETHQFDPEFTYNPYMARYWEAVHFKAMNPDKPIPPASDLVSAMITPDPLVLRRAQKSLRLFNNQMKLKRLVKKKDSSSPLDLAAAAATAAAAALASTSVTSVREDEEENNEEVWFADEQRSLVDFVSELNPVEDFKSLLAREGREDLAINGMIEIIRKLVGPQGDEIYYDKAMECLKALREGIVKCGGGVEREAKFNNFMDLLKAGLLFENPNSLFWQRMVAANVELIAPNAEEVSQLYYSSASQATTTQGTTQSSTQSKIFDDDLFDEME